MACQLSELLGTVSTGRAVSDVTAPGGWELLGPGESYLGRTGEDTLYGVCLVGQVLLHGYFRLCRLSPQLRPATPGCAGYSTVKTSYSWLYRLSYSKGQLLLAVQAISTVNTSYSWLCRLFYS